ncbi:MAG: V-type ATPase subunit [Treponema sp.]|jgi:hypothetical protein|nr:V-type ATPase subunit [Treponema sp.]
MAGAGERAYVYAKACGIIGKSFVGRRIAALRPLNRLSELDRLIFGSRARELPERELLPDLERRLIRRSSAAVVSLAASYRNPPEFLSLLVRVYEYADLKTALALAAGGEYGAKLGYTPLGSFGTVHFEAWPDIRVMLAGTDFEFLLDKDGLRKDFEGLALETVLDRRYYLRLLESMAKLKKNDRRAAEKIITEEISLRNCAWMLRLRTYYGMEGAEVERHLVEYEGRSGKAGCLAADAFAALEFPLDSRGPWEKWKRSGFLNPEGIPGGFQGPWHADPRYFQNAASEYLYRLALHAFRRRPFSLDTAFCFIKLKQFEEDLLTSGAEGLGMGMSGRDILGVIGGEK